MKLVRCDECQRTAPAEQLFGSAPKGWTELMATPQNFQFCSTRCVTAFVNRPAAPELQEA